MRRSEMVELIKKLIDAGKEWADLDTRAENLLANLEDAGMLPPKYIIKTVNLGALYEDEKDKLIPIYKNKWEPEYE